MNTKFKKGNYVTKEKEKNEILYYVDAIKYPFATIKGVNERIIIDSPISELTKTTLEEYNNTPAGKKTKEKENNFMKKQ